MNGKSYSFKLFAIEAITVLAGLLFLVPFYFVLVNSFKSLGDLMSDTTSFPTHLSMVNYQRAWEALEFPRVLLNSTIITVFSILSLIFFSSMTAYRLVRQPSKTNQFLFYMFVAAMIIPFQAIMIPLVKFSNWFGLMNSLIGIIIVYTGMGVSFCIILYHGFIKSVPLEIEEAAAVDGCNPYRLFWGIVFPLLKPMTVSIVVLQSMWIWNDFLLPMLFLQKPEHQTLQLSIYTLFGEYAKQWDLALAALVMIMIPILLLYFVLQRYVVSGIMVGAVKG